MQTLLQTYNSLTKLLPHKGTHTPCAPFYLSDFQQLTSNNNTKQATDPMPATCFVSCIAPKSHVPNPAFRAN